MMNRQEIIRFYKNKIDDVSDETKREELFKQLDEIEELLISLDVEIDEELKYQEDHIEDEIDDDYNYYRSVINQWIYMKV